MYLKIIEYFFKTKTDYICIGSLDKEHKSRWVNKKTDTFCVCK